MKYYIIAGEASGDLHASNLMKALRKKDPNAEFRVWGGDLMQAQGGDVVKHYRELAFMGFLEVIKNIRTILSNISFCKQDILDYKPDALILVDYPGFNLRIAEFGYENNLKVLYYISPQVWAWKQSRVKKIRKVVDQMYVILPFEKDFYNKHNYEVKFVGHPLLDAIAGRERLSDDVFQEKHQLDGRPIVALLPGSRQQEIANMLPVMLSVRSRFPDYQFVLAGAPSVEEETYRAHGADNDLKIIKNQTYDLLEHSHAALVSSGTATLETALFKVPEVVCYKTSNFSYQIAKRLVKIKYISLVNLVVDKEIVTELIQEELNTDRITKELQAILEGEKRETLLSNYDELHQRLGGGGASEKTADLIWEYLQ